MAVRKKYIVKIWRDIEPELLGPYPNGRKRNDAARKIRDKEGLESSLFRLDCEGNPDLYTFAGVDDV